MAEATADRRQPDCGREEAVKVYPMTKPQPNGIFETASTARAAVAATSRAETGSAHARELSPAARALTEQPYEPA